MCNLLRWGARGIEIACQPVNMTIAVHLNNYTLPRKNKTAREKDKQATKMVHDVANLNYFTLQNRTTKFISKIKQVEKGILDL